MKLLIGSCGGLTGYYLAKLFRHRQPLFYIYGMDANDPMSTRTMIDEFVFCPRLTEKKSFITFLLDYLNREEIDYYLPTHSLETMLIAEYEGYISENTNTKFVVSPYKTYMSLNDKETCNKSLSNIGIKVPRLYSVVPDNAYPVFIKPKIGSGSRDSYIAHNKNEYQLFNKLASNQLVMEYINGNEYTVDAAFGNSGELISYNQRIRKKQLGGATIYTYNDYSIDVKNQLMQISNQYLCKGIVNFQFILCNNEAYFTDVNLRYASGGLPLSVKSGMDVVDILLGIMNGDNLKEKDYPMDRRRVVMYRHFDETYSVL